MTRRRRRGRRREEEVKVSLYLWLLLDALHSVILPWRLALALASPPDQLGVEFNCRRNFADAQGHTHGIPCLTLYWYLRGMDS